MQTESNDTLYVLLPPPKPAPDPVPVFTVIEDLQTYLAGQSGGTTIDTPIAVRLSIDLSSGTASRNAYRGGEPEQAAIASIKSCLPRLRANMSLLI
ncbi:hypothetical protein [Treponema endosymbiont of Eucomonympha sp.]|uniref:hypothetical protein n=1 Tax=Treponema endosymbiont of Eucomonympha sp. TaxID=1580831 RepID=UPI000750C9C8|nr:hypothetical protein [Treponema endosymbiont of Eucomonympha sp.]